MTREWLLGMAEKAPGAWLGLKVVELVCFLDGHPPTQAMKVAAPQFDPVLTEGGSANSSSIEARGTNGRSEVHPRTAGIVEHMGISQHLSLLPRSGGNFRMTDDTYEVTGRH